MSTPSSIRFGGYAVPDGPGEPFDPFEGPGLSVSAGRSGPGLWWSFGGYRKMGIGSGRGVGSFAWLLRPFVRARYWATWLWASGESFPWSTRTAWMCGSQSAVLGRYQAAKPMARSTLTLRWWSAGARSTTPPPACVRPEAETLVLYEPW